MAPYVAIEVLARHFSREVGRGLVELCRRTALCCLRRDLLLAGTLREKCGDHILCDTVGDIFELFVLSTTLAIVSLILRTLFSLILVS